MKRLENRKKLDLHGVCGVSRLLPIITITTIKFRICEANIHVIKCNDFIHKHLVKNLFDNFSAILRKMKQFAKKKYSKDLVPHQMVIFILGENFRSFNQYLTELM